MDDFLWKALWGGLGIALLVGPLGCFVVWRRMAYFGDTLSHSALLGVTLGFLLKTNLNITLLGVCIATALLLVVLQRQERLATDTLLGILSHSALSLGIVTLTFVQGLRIDLSAYLFGDLLTVTQTDLYWVYGGGGIVLGGLFFLWRPLLSITLHEELAQVEGIPVARTRLLFMLLVAIVVAISMKIIGVLLITALLIIPPATAQAFSRTPEQMALLASLTGCLSVIIGLGISWQWDTPTSPSIVVAATLLFVITLLLPKKYLSGN